MVEDVDGVHAWLNAGARLLSVAQLAASGHERVLQHHTP